MSQITSDVNTHTPVLLSSVLEYLPQKKGFLFDGTFGGGGYSKVFLEQGWDVYSSDLDAQAVEKAGQLAVDYPNFSIVHGAFDNVIEKFDDGRFQAIVVDLGYSSNQLEYSGRGFSYQKGDEELDLRFSDDVGMPVWKKISRLKEGKDLGRVLYKYSGERLSMKIGERIFEANEPHVKVSKIVEAVDGCLAPQDKKHKNKILSRVWQSLRIWVNDEHDHLSRFLPLALDRLAPGGRLIVVNFHSLEDKVVAQFMRTAARPIEIDDYGNKEQHFKLLTRKAVVPTEEEIEENNRARSARMRVIEKM